MRLIFLKKPAPHACMNTQSHQGNSMATQLKALKGYPPEKYYCLFKQYFKNKASDSKGIGEVLKHFFDTKVTEKEKEQLLHQYRFDQKIKKR